MESSTVADSVNGTIVLPNNLSDAVTDSPLAPSVNLMKTFFEIESPIVAESSFTSFFSTFSIASSIVAESVIKSNVFLNI